MQPINLNDPWANPEVVMYEFYTKTGYYSLTRGSDISIVAVANADIIAAVVDDGIGQTRVFVKNRFGLPGSEIESGVSDETFEAYRKNLKAKYGHWWDTSFQSPLGLRVLAAMALIVAIHPGPMWQVFLLAMSGQLAAEGLAAEWAAIRRRPG